MTKQAGSALTTMPSRKIRWAQHQFSGIINAPTTISYFFDKSGRVSRHTQWVTTRDPDRKFSLASYNRISVQHQLREEDRKSSIPIFAATPSLPNLAQTATVITAAPQRSYQLVRIGGPSITTSIAHLEPAVLSNSRDISRRIRRS